MSDDDERADKPTEEDKEEIPPVPLIHVDVSRETVQKAARLADEYEIALADALMRLTAFNFPADALDGSAGETEDNCGP